MNQVAVYIITGCVMFVMGFAGLVIQKHLLRKVLALNIMGSGVFMVLTAVAHWTGGSRPDPVPHALVLTGIVVAVSASAFGMMLIRRVFEETGKSELPGDDEDRIYDPDSGDKEIQ